MEWPDWRIHRGWSAAELEQRLADVPRLTSTAPRSEQDAQDARWRRYHSQAVIAREPPGRPLPDGPFMRARKLITLYAFSDPRIVEAHFDPRGALAGRPMLLELKSIGGRFLCAVRVGAVRDDGDVDQTVWGYRYDTCAGHIESGWEWFLLTKRHETGEIWFRIEAVWRPGDFPNLVTRAGFALLGKRYQRAWHRLAYLRLRELLDARGLPAVPRGSRLVHLGPELPTPPSLVTSMTGSGPPGAPHEVAD